MKQILATFMRKLGCSYDTASNGLIALEQVEKSSRRYDLILMGGSTSLLNTPYSEIANCVVVNFRFINAYNGRAGFNQ